MLWGLGRAYLLLPVPGIPWSSPMTLTRFVTKNAFRNKRRSILTVLSIALSLLLLTLMMTLWHAFALDDGSAESAQRLVVRHRVSLTFTLPMYYREKIRAIPGVVAVVPVSWFGGIYKDQKPENFFPQVRHRSRRILQGLSRYPDAGRSDQSMAARSPGRNRR